MPVKRRSFFPQSRPQPDASLALSIPKPAGGSNPSGRGGPGGSGMMGGPTGQSVTPPPPAASPSAGPGQPTFGLESDGLSQPQSAAAAPPAMPSALSPGRVGELLSPRQPSPQPSPDQMSNPDQMPSQMLPPTTPMIMLRLLKALGQL
jgi:hypothetical protein